MLNSYNSFTNEFPCFHLNLQILADEFVGRFQHVHNYCQKDPLNLDGIRMYQPDSILSPTYIYLITASEVPQNIKDFQQNSFLIVGEVDYSLFPDICRILQVGNEDDFSLVFTIAQQTFEKYQQWDRNLLLSMNSTNPLDEMLTFSLEIFQNPIFAHDSNFYILSCPRHVQGMSVWEKDSRTGRLIAPLSLIHDFKIDMEYLRTLNTTGSDIYSKDLRGYRILYRNLWIDGIYEGRICIDELQTALLPGQFFVLEYLGSFIEQCIGSNNLFQLNRKNDMRQFFSDFLDETLSDFQKIPYYLSFLNWNRDDRYLCLHLDTEQQNEHMHSSAATLGHIEYQIPSGIAFLYHEGIAVIVNLSYDHSSIPDVISSLAIILREGLFKMGASSQIHDFMLLPQGHTQATAALELGKRSGSMIWCHRFDDYVLEYILDESSSRISPELLCSDALAILQKYDEKNNTELYHTLKTYLELERNVLQTANTLFIHRSTLFYRIERIRKLTNIDLDNSKTRLILLLSFRLIESEKGILDVFI